MQRVSTSATRSEIAKAKKLLKEAQTAPVFALTSDHALNRGGFAGEAWSRVYGYVALIAKVHGLPDIDRQYGLDLNTGEFLSDS